MSDNSRSGNEYEWWLLLSWGSWDLGRRERTSAVLFLYDVWIDKGIGCGGGGSVKFWKVGACADA